MRPRQAVFEPGNVAAQHGHRRLIQEHAAVASHRPVAAGRHEQAGAGGSALRHREGRVHVDARPRDDAPVVAVDAVPALVVVAGREGGRDVAPPDRGQLRPVQRPARRQDFVKFRHRLPDVEHVQAVTLIDARQRMVLSQPRRHLRIRLLTLERGILERFSRVERLQRRSHGRNAVRCRLVVLPPVRAKEPGAVAPDGATPREIGLVDGPCRRRAFPTRVVAVPREGLIGPPSGARELVAAALADHVEHEAVAHRRGRIDAARLDLDVLDGFGTQGGAVDVRVVVVAGHHAFHVDDGVAVIHGVPEIVLAPAAIVVRPRHHPRRHVQEIAPVLAFDEGKGLLEFALDVQDVAGTGHLDHRRIAADGDRFRQRAECHRDIHLEGRAGTQQDAFAAEHRKRRQLRGQRVGARRQVDQPVPAVGIADREAGSEQRGARCRDGHAWHGRGLLIFDRSAEAAITSLGAGDRRERADEQESNCYNDRSHGGNPFVEERRLNENANLNGHCAPVARKICRAAADVR